jgi:hypothetical protein
MKGRRRTLKVFSDKNNQSLERSDGLSSPTMVCSWYLPTALFRIASDQLFDCVAEDITVP